MLQDLAPGHGMLCRKLTLKRSNPDTMWPTPGRKGCSMPHKHCHGHTEAARAAVGQVT